MWLVLKTQTGEMPVTTVAYFVYLAKAFLARFSFSLIFFPLYCEANDRKIVIHCYQARNGFDSPSLKSFRFMNFIHHLFLLFSGRSEFTKQLAYSQI